MKISSNLFRIQKENFAVWRYMIVLLLVFATHFQSTAQTMMPLPNFNNVYTGNVRGYWFTAPTSFIITGLKVPADAGPGTQNIHVMKINDATPVAFSNTSTNFTTLAYIQGAPNNVVQTVNIQVNQGDIIGILGQAGTANSYSVTPGPFPSTILGQAVTLERLIYQGDITSGPAPNYSWEVGTSSISRVEMYYTASTLCSGTPVLGTATGPSNVCLNQSVNVVGSTPAVGGLALQWQESSNGTTWTDIAGATSTTYSMPGGITADTYFRLEVTCTASSSVAYSNDVFVQLTTAQPTPWTYDVESAMNTTNSQIEDCWSSSPNNTTAAFRWNVGSGTTPSTATGPNGAFSGSKYFYTEASSGSNGDLAYLSSPLIDLSNLNVPQLSFYYHMYGADINTLNVQVSSDNGVTWTTETTIIGEQQTSNGDAWIEETVLLNNYSGNIALRFEASKGSSFNGDISLDDISIREAPTCIKPSNLLASNISSTSADLSWTENNGSTTWNVEWGPAGFVQGSAAGNLQNGVSNPYNITINPNTTYEFYVQTDCGGGDISFWAGPFEFTNAYCDFTITNTSPQHITSFITNGAIVDIINPASGPGTTNPGYSDFTATVMDAFETQIIDFEIDGSIQSTLWGASIFVDWNNNYVFDANEKVYGTTGYQSNPISNTFTIPSGTPVGQYRMRVVASYIQTTPLACSGTSSEAEDYTINVITPPTCLPPVNLDTVSTTTNSVELSWTSLSGATNWIIEYGLSGFTPGSGTEVNATTNPFTVTPLNPSANYDFYVRSDCGGGDSSAWRGPLSVYTACGIAVAPFYEGFDNGVEPQCWENTTIGTTGINNIWKFNGTPGYGAAPALNGRANDTYAWLDASYANDSNMLITPEIDISQLTTPYLSFEWFSTNNNTPDDTHPLIIEVFDGTAWNYIDTLMADSSEWMFVNYDLSAFSNNIIQVRFMVNQTTTTSSAFYTDILLDEVRIDDCISLGGVDGSFDVCRLDSTVDLNNNIITKPNGGGIWSFPSGPTFLTQDSIFNVTFLPAGTYEVYYVERYVCYDTTVATINVFNPSSAGIDGTDEVCKNEPLDLFGALGGSIDLGGEWFDFTNTLLPNSQPNAQAIPGQYNYYYVANNGVCPADTAIVNITVKSDCDFLSLGEELFTEISVHPNPATSQLNIVNPSNTASLKVEMLDMNGRVVLVENKALSNATNATLVIDHLERGIYTLRIYNNEGQKTFKVVKQ